MATKTRVKRKRTALPISNAMMTQVVPLTENQEKIFKAWEDGKHMFIYGCAGEIGFLPGDHEDKSSLYQIPYKNMVKYMFELNKDRDFEVLYGGLKAQESIKFWSTSFLRGVTLDNSVIIIDEMQNLNFHELDSIITRVGENSRIIFCGDAMQSDLVKDREKNGIHDFMRILEFMPDDFTMVEMGIDDICRSGLVRNYLLAKNQVL